jgi:hypothetical protein
VSLCTFLGQFVNDSAFTFPYYMRFWNIWDGSVIIVARLWAGWPGFNSQQEQEFFSLPLCLYHLWGPPSFLSSGHLGPFLGVRWWGHEADHSSPSSAKVINVWSYTSIALYVFIAWWLIKKAQRKLHLILPYLLKSWITCIYFGKNCFV